MCQRLNTGESNNFYLGIFICIGPNIANIALGLIWSLILQNKSITSILRHGYIEWFLVGGFLRLGYASNNISSNSN